MKKIGLVGGISWVSTLDYYKYINEEINLRLGGLNYAECIIYSLNFGDVQSKGWDNSFELLHYACENLEAAGAELIVLCANSAHLMIEPLTNKIKIPFINIATVVAEAIHAQNFKKVGLLGTVYTMGSDLYPKELKKYGIECITPEKQDTRDFIQRTLRDELGKGIVRPETKRHYISIIDELIDRGAEGIILGCTEIPLIITTMDVSVPIFDTTKIHALTAVNAALSE